MAISSLAVTASSRLSQDLMPANGASLRQTNQQETNTVATYAEPSGNAASLVILNDKNLYAVSRDTTSASGWAFQAVAQGCTDVAEVVCGLDSLTGQIYALFTTSGATYWMTWSAEPESWGSPQMLTGVSGACRNLSVTYTASSARMIVFAVSSDGALVRATAQLSGGWTASSVDLPGDLLSQTTVPPLVTYLSEEVWLLAFCSKGQLVTYEGQDTATTSQASMISLPGGASANQAILAFPGRDGDGSVCLLVTDENGQLYSSGYSAAAGTTPVSLGNSTKIVNASGWVGIDGNFALFASDFSGMLWLVRQTGWTGDGNATWSTSIPITPLVAGVSFDTASALTQAPGQVFLQGYDLSLRFIQLANGGNWRPVEVRQPSGGGNANVITYQVRMTVTDANSVPQPGTSVSVKASNPAFFWCNQGTYLADMVNTVPLTTDTMGGLTLSIPAFSPNMPTLTIWSGETQIGTVQPDRQIHNYLAGQTQESYLPPQFDGSTLASATTHNIDGSWNAASPVAPGVAGSPLVAAAIAGAMSGCSAATLGLIQGVGVSSLDAVGVQVGWVLDLSNPDQGFQSLTDKESFDAAYQQIFGMSPASAFSVELSSYSILSGIGDLLDAAWNLAVAVQKFAWEFATHSLSLLIDLGGDLTQLVVAVIEDPADIGAAFHALIHQAEGQVGDFLDWLANYLPFGDFKTAQQTVATALTSLPTAISSELSTAKSELAGWISTNKAALDQALSDLKAKYQGQTIAQAFGNLAPFVLASTVAGEVPQILGTRSQWFFAKSVNCGGGSSYDWADDSNTQSCESLAAQIASPSADLAALVEDFINLANEIAKTCIDIATAESTPVGQFLTNAQGLLDTCLSILQELGDLLIDSGLEGCGCFSQILQQPFLADLGVLGTLIQDIAGIAGEDVDPSSATVLSWALAIPMVLTSWDLGMSDMWDTQPQQDAENRGQNSNLSISLVGDSNYSMLVLSTCISIVLTGFSDVFASGETESDGEPKIGSFGIPLLANFSYAVSLYFTALVGWSAAKLPGRASFVLDCCIVFFNFFSLYRSNKSARDPLRGNSPTTPLPPTLLNYKDLRAGENAMAGPAIVSGIGFSQTILGGLENVVAEKEDISIVVLPLCLNMTEFLAAYGKTSLLVFKEILNLIALVVWIISQDSSRSAETSDISKE